MIELIYRQYHPCPQPNCVFPGLKLSSGSFLRGLTCYVVDHPNTKNKNYIISLDVAVESNSRKLAIPPDIFHAATC